MAVFKAYRHNSDFIQIKHARENTFTGIKLLFNKMLQDADVNDVLTITINGDIVYRIWNEGVHKGQIIIDKTKADWV